MLEAKREAEKWIQEAEDAKKAAIMMMNDEREAAARAESQRLAELKLKASGHYEEQRSGGHKENPGRPGL